MIDLHIKKTTSKNFEHYSIIYDVKINGKRTSKVYENIGNLETLKKRAGNEEPLIWLNNYVKDLNKQLKENSLPINIMKNPNKKIESNIKVTFNAGYLFLQDIYYSLGINNICNSIKAKYQFHYDLNNILSNLIYSRIIYPSQSLKL